MKTVIVDRREVALEIRKSGIVVDGQHIPFRLVDLLVLCGDISLSTKTLIALSRERIPLIAVSKNNRDFSLTLPMEAKNSELRMRQYDTASRRRIEYARYYLERKIKTHVEHLASTGTALDFAIWKSKIDNAETVPELLGVEGSFSRLYFNHFFKLLPSHLHKGKRSKRPPLDPVNAILSYLYTFGYHLIASRLVMYGFDASIGYLHESFRSHFALASDMMECFRADTNKKTVELFDDGLLTADDFSKKGAVYLRSESRKRFWKEIKPFIDELTHDVDDEIALLRMAIS
ncbi:CRISPR-associated endonuclease Cas1 [Hydrogenimonas cancrithermarum]|uniref:CRISPR-associated endonuclease Cas1 n=1 Tax=Hydrogenimonas cancrithermarum TaxID=2993563 RepID=A0ABN6WSM1_9BACT|nr:CRISPR-associated endonuclease Cas1 [Hydrogenimonas cancrithermarum]BDY11967.1 CRISPR-associated endonuclease Cas1 1 [Hydrogenimonas cancrithermarum]